MSKDDPKFLCRLPADVKAFVEKQADRYGSSMNSEIVRALRERMERISVMEMPVWTGE